MITETDFLNARDLTKRKRVEFFIAPEFVFALFIGPIVVGLSLIVLANSEAIDKLFTNVLKSMMGL